MIKDDFNPRIYFFMGPLIILFWLLKFKIFCFSIKTFKTILHQILLLFPFVFFFVKSNVTIILCCSLN